MKEYLRTFYEGATEISPDEIIGALAIGLVLSMACSGLCILGRKRSANVFPVFCGLIFAVSAISMVVGIGHARFKYVGTGRLIASEGPYSRTFPGEWRPGPPPGGPPMPHRIGWPLLQEADANKDGHLTPEEAARFVREADPTGKGWADAHDLDHARRGPAAPPSATQDRPGPAAPGSNPTDPAGPGARQ